MTSNGDRRLTDFPAMSSLNGDWAHARWLGPEGASADKENVDCRIHTYPWFNQE